jgi:hypothetical protein
MAFSQEEDEQKAINTLYARVRLWTAYEFGNKQLTNASQTGTSNQIKFWNHYQRGDFWVEAAVSANMREEWTSAWQWNQPWIEFQAVYWAPWKNDWGIKLYMDDQMFRGGDGGANNYGAALFDRAPVGAAFVQLFNKKVYLQMGAGDVDGGRWNSPGPYGFNDFEDSFFLLAFNQLVPGLEFGLRYWRWSSNQQYDSAKNDPWAPVRDGGFNSDLFAFGGQYARDNFRMTTAFEPKNYIDFGAWYRVFAGLEFAFDGIAEEPLSFHNGGWLNIAENAIWNSGPLRIGLAFKEENIGRALDKDRDGAAIPVKPDQGIQLVVHPHIKYTFIDRMLIGKLEAVITKGIGAANRELATCEISPWLFFGPRNLVTEDLDDYDGLCLRYIYKLGKDAEGKAVTQNQIFFGIKFRYSTPPPPHAGCPVKLHCPPLFPWRVALINVEGGMDRIFL